MKKYSGCNMCTFANQIKTIIILNMKKCKLYSLFELSTPNNSTYMYIDAHTSHFMSTPVFVALQPVKFKLVCSATETSLTPEI